MTTHILIQGGQRTSNPDYAMYPGVLPGLNDVFETASHKGPAVYAATRVLDFDGGSLVTNINVPRVISPESWGSTALRHYSQRVAQIAAADVLQVAVMPRFSTLVRLHWIVAKVLSAGTADLRIKGLSTSVGAVLTLQAGIDLTTVGSGLIDVQAANGGKPLYFDQNDALEVVINSLPSGVTNADGTYGGGIQGLALILTPIIEEYARGAF